MRVLLNDIVMSLQMLMRENRVDYIAGDGLQVDAPCPSSFSVYLMDSSGGASINRQTRQKRVQQTDP